MFTIEHDHEQDKDKPLSQLEITYTCYDYSIEL